MWSWSRKLFNSHCSNYVAILGRLNFKFDCLLNWCCILNILVLWSRNLKSKLFLFLTIWVAFILSSICPRKPNLYVVDKHERELICMGVYVTCIKSRNIIREDLGTTCDLVRILLFSADVCIVFSIGHFSSPNIKGIYGLTCRSSTWQHLVTVPGPLFNRCFVM